MKLYSTLPEKITAKLAASAGLEIAGDHTGQDTISIIIRKSKSGGVDDPTAFIAHPSNCIVIAGTPDDTGQAFSEAAEQAGVPAENIYLLPAGQGLSVKVLIDKVIELQQQLAKKPNEAEDDDIIFLDDDEAPPPAQSRDRVIAVRGYRGGVGATTIATSLAALLHDNGGKIALLDLGIPQNAKYHSGTFKTVKKDGFLMAETELWDLYISPVPVFRLEEAPLTNLIEILRKEYRWVVVDLSPQPDNKHIKAITADKTVVVVDSDILQSVEPASKEKDALFVYNKVIPDIGADLIEDILSRTVITVKTDFDGCYAALAAGVPANRFSEEMAVAMGKLASQI